MLFLLIYFKPFLNKGDHLSYRNEIIKRFGGKDTEHLGSIMTNVGLQRKPKVKRVVKQKAKTVVKQKVETVVHPNKEIRFSHIASPIVIDL